MHQTMLTVYFLPIALFMVQWQVTLATSDVDKVNVLDLISSVFRPYGYNQGEERGAGKAT
ncbi:unnamed protein product [Brassica napus]|uniref:(rape) hypothetical protein n=1 Tax=Brassica napus TaxID=3708 RepID=A0A816U9N9_BRANA|nr:unnamed protein product [Brassica napus]